MNRQYFDAATFLIWLACPLLPAFTLLGCRTGESTDARDLRTTNLILQTIADAHFRYREINGVRITRTADLPLLVDVLENAEEMKSIHVSDIKAIRNFVLAFSDGWARKLRVLEKSDGTVELQSAGVDGVFATTDDIAVNL